MDLLSWGPDHVSELVVPPIVNPVVFYRWELGQAITESEIQTAERKREGFQTEHDHFAPFMFEAPGSRDVYRPSSQKRE